MIYTRLHGFLGNQMFQYAAAAQLAARLKVPVALDPRRAEEKGQGNLTSIFNLPVVAPAHLPPDRRRRPVAYTLWRYLGGTPRLRREKGLGYDPDFETWGDESYLHGYWQSETYFAGIKDHLRDVFTMVPQMSPANAAMADRIASGPSVALHVRRGDYVALGATAVCDQAYYDAALAAVTEGLSVSPTVFVFSDDPDWARDNLSIPFEKVVVDLNGRATAHEDMRLMSLCQHNVIANSTFSWWSAWLNPHAGRRVAAPARWFANDHQRNPDILPDDWIPIG
ncbi:alpha-1,2-fucosyltransferase [Sulfitobacter alexandrii]|uniref:Alpha-1,2-fucosyltransferase n=1 Tax=Sulfitobacter alexandrii TaxID=1917485 RepID=A0A1J0WKY9_9RHOB|nr:alpha-1,2-fucosyltransferase [Sulfitobacter alexandrii]APE44824.1 alpha-1,2-fucosyltransferase [Sulfitobacter alexandrii]